MSDGQQGQGKDSEKRFIEIPIDDTDMEEVEKLTKARRGDLEDEALTEKYAPTRHELIQLLKCWFEAKLYEEWFGVEGHIDKDYEEVVKNLKLKTTEVLSVFGYQVVQEDDGTAWVESADDISKAGQTE